MVAQSHLFFVTILLASPELVPLSEVSSGRREEQPSVQSDQHPQSGKHSEQGKFKLPTADLAKL